jgi:hypothetical protein
MRGAVDNLSQVTVERSVDKLRMLTLRPQQVRPVRSRLFFVQLGLLGVFADSVS